MAARANASGGTCFASPKAAHMATAAYGLQAPRKPMHTATDSCGEEPFTRIYSTLRNLAYTVCVLPADLYNKYVKLLSVCEKDWVP